jgi:hypothetical protein
MKLAQLKSAVLSIAGITTEWVRSEFGDLRLKSTWQAAYDRCSEFVAVAVDAVTSDRAMAIYEVVFSLIAIIAIVLWRQVSVIAKIAYAYGSGKAFNVGRDARRRFDSEFENLVNLATFAAL